MLNQEEMPPTPSVSLAYPLAVQSYDWFGKRLDFLDARIQGILGLQITLTLATPIALKALDVEFREWWIAVAAVAFLVAIGLGIYARLAGHMAMMSLEIIYDSWIQDTEEDFKRQFVYYAGKHFNHNNKLLKKRYNLLIMSIICFASTVVLLGVSVAFEALESAELAQ